MKHQREVSIVFSVKGGRMEIDRDIVAREVRRLPDGDYSLTISDPIDTRSKTWLQVKYWWPVPVQLLAEHCGYTPAQMHYSLLGEWSGWVDGPNGHPIPTKPSMSDYTLTDMRAIIDWVLTWGPSQLNVVIPEPDKNWKKKKGRYA